MAKTEEELIKKVVKLLEQGTSAKNIFYNIKQACGGDTLDADLIFRRGSQRWSQRFAAKLLEEK